MRPPLASGNDTSMPKTTCPFPDGFLWGTATAAHQVEGGITNNDWWDWEHAGGSPCVEPSGDAVDHWHRYRDDIALLAALGFDTYRFSVEWSRIEPADGEFSSVALDHYRRVCATCLEHGINPIVTYHHFTTPRWLAAQGGWDADVTTDRYLRFAEVVSTRLGDLVHSVCTFNEPNIVSLIGYLVGHFPPGVQDAAARRRVNDRFVSTHERAVPVIKGAGVGDKPVGLTVSMSEWVAVGDGAAANVERYRRGHEDVFLEAARADDFVGVQTYSRTRVGVDGQLPPEDGVETTLMGYEFWPEALEATIRPAWSVTDGTPIVVTENGIGTDDDARRVEYLQRALRGVAACLEDGIDVRGYVQWSLMDNFEWAEGYRPTFGLVAVDRATQERVPKPSARWLGAVARGNGSALF
jgi:beta-glucosidase